MSETSRCGIVVIDATKDASHLEVILDELAGLPEFTPLVLCAPGQDNAIRNELQKRPKIRTCGLEENATVENFLSSWAELPVEWIAYLPCGEQTIACLSLLRLPFRPNAITPLVPKPALSKFKQVDHHLQQAGWCAPQKIAADLLRRHGRPAGCDLRALFDLVHLSAYRVDWWSSPASTETLPIPQQGVGKSLTLSSRVLAVISHFHCAEWLEEALYSLIHQTRRPDHIVVIDDASGKPPVEIVAGFPEVTLLSSPENIRPERILHHVMEWTDFDAYMIQDADDWSAINRLELLLNEAERTGAELIGTQEFEISSLDASLMLRTFPLDPNFAMLKQLGYYMSHASSLVARTLAVRIGGLDATFKVSSDYDFFQRASMAARLVNVPEFAHYRRLRAGSLTHAADTGIYSQLRRMESIALYTRAQKNLKILRAGGTPDYRAKKRLDLAPFLHITGPSLPMSFCHH